jgi:orotate phosphoribosyltransferase
LPVLVYTGLSGVSTATALALALDEYEVKYGMAYVRKTGEQSHGSPVERTGNISAGVKYYMVFVDDFICGGDTAHRCYKKMNTTFRKPIGIMFSMCRPGINSKAAMADLTSQYGKIKGS